MGKKAAIYIRVSTLDQARDGYSLAHQESSLRKWCADHDYDIYDLYADRGKSAKDIRHRPDMRRLMADARTHCFDTVVFWALSRFTRSVRDLYDTLEKFQAWDISMYSYTEAFDTSTPMGRAMIGIIGVFAQLERELTSERVAAAMFERACQGKRTCSEILGYDLDGKDSFVINKKEAEFVLYCFDAYLKHKNLKKVADLCQEKGYRGKRGKAPTPWSVSVMLTRPVYCGYNLFHGQLYKGDYDPIISPDKYNAVQMLLASQKRAGRTKKAPLILIR